MKTTKKAVVGNIQEIKFGKGGQMTGYSSHEHKEVEKIIKNVKQWAFKVGHAVL